ncbi:MAG: hypothetical protein ACYCY8_06270 [Burkholderiales bacterium]
MSNFWIVGAMWGGKSNGDALDEFLTEGYWYCWPISEYCDYSPRRGNSIGAQQDRCLQIKSGDRIAVKKILSIRSQLMVIRAIGVAIGDFDKNKWRVSVDWHPICQPGAEIGRQVALKGCTASIHRRSYINTDPWVSQVFYEQPA